MFRFHDPVQAQSWRELVALHWQANLLMLRSPKAVVLFCAISFVPIILFLGAWRLAWTFVDTDTILARQGELFLLSIVAFLVFVVAQHLAFVQAMKKTYAPFVRRALQARGTPVCLRCGHLVSHDAIRCPECGASPEPPPAPPEHTAKRGACERSHG